MVLNAITLDLSVFDVSNVAYLSVDIKLKKPSLKVSDDLNKTDRQKSSVNRH